MTLDNSTPLSTARSFLAGIRARDGDSMAALCHPETQVINIRGGQVSYNSLAFILDLVVKGDVEQDEFSSDEVEHIDGDFATVWTPYEFTVNGKLSHTGSNSFSLFMDPKKG